jgi:MFS family permease
VQIAESVAGRRRIVRHVGSARDEAELGLLIEEAHHTLLAVAPWYVLTPLIAMERLGGVDIYDFLLTSFGTGGLLGARIAGRFKPRFARDLELGRYQPVRRPVLLLSVTTETAVLLAGFAVAWGGRAPSSSTSTRSPRSSARSRAPTSAAR